MTNEFAYMDSMHGPFGHMHGGMDPSANNQPLQFNNKKGKVPMAITGEDIDLRTHDGLDSMAPVNGSEMAMANMGMGPMTPMTQWTSMVNPMGMPDPGMMMAYGQFGGFMPSNGGMPMMTPDGMSIQKEIITMEHLTLYPPPQNAPSQTTREKPPGCRTIFVGGLPENCTEDLIREMFESCGTICSVRLSKKNFAHVRFEMHDSVEKALYISGYRMKIGDSEEKENYGRIHVDYAQARDDLYEWECLQRVLAREQRHRERLEEERLRPPSPEPVTHFSDMAATVLLDKIKNDETFAESLPVLSTWLERGDCSRRTASIFYSLIQSTNAQVRRLLNDKAALDEELASIKYSLQQKQAHIMHQFEQIESVYASAGKQKAWDHFTKAQRKNIILWSKQCQEIRQSQQQEFFNERQEDEMEMSDTDDADSSSKKKRKKVADAETVLNEANEWIASQIREENASLKCQLEAYRNEVELLQQEVKETNTTNASDDTEKQLKTLQLVMQGMQQQLITSKQQLKKSEENVTKLKQEKAAALAAVAAAGKSNKSRVDKPQTAEDEDSKGGGGREEAEEETSDGTTEDNATISTSNVTTVNEHEAKFIGVIATFLHVHPFGASVDYIWSYLQRLQMKIRSSEIEDLLEKLPSVFQSDLLGVGAALEKRWRFIGFSTDALSSANV